MSVLNELASAYNRRDEAPNQQLAMKLAEAENADEVSEDIQELVDNLKNRNKQIRSDCIKVLYEIGAIKPILIEMYVDEFVTLLSHKDNRLVWGGMTALGRIAECKPHEIWAHVDTIIEATQNGSAITQDWGIRVLAAVSAENVAYAVRIYPFLMRFLEDCLPKDVPRHAENIAICASTNEQKRQLREVLKAHQPQLKPSQLKRVGKVIQAIDDEQN